MKYPSALWTLLSMEEHHVRAKQEEPEEGSQACFTAITLEQAMLFSQIQSCPWLWQLVITFPETLNENNSLFHESMASLTDSHREFSGSQKPAGMLLYIISFQDEVINPVSDFPILIRVLDVALVSIHPCLLTVASTVLWFLNHPSPRSEPDQKHKQRQRNMMFLPLHTSGTFWKEWGHFKSMWNLCPVFTIHEGQATSFPWISLRKRRMGSIPGISKLCSKFHFSATAHWPLSTLIELYWWVDWLIDWLTKSRAKTRNQYDRIYNIHTPRAVS